MKEFRTELRVLPSRTLMALQSRVITQGSCFTDAIGKRMADYKMRALINPFGIIYNPESIHKVLGYSLFNEPLPDHTFLQNQEVHLNYNVHSELSALKKEDLVANLVNTIGVAHHFLKDADWMLMTYGTAWVYHRQDTGEIVANCHKLPYSAFFKSLMSVDDICVSFRAFYSQLKKFNPRLKIILTVSPVRHVKDTLELNSVSKAILRVACHEISKLEDVDYFPAFEIMMDDLRDYRFYKSDLLHPTSDAEDYIWDKFMERYFSVELKEFVQQWKGILSALRHKPFHAKSRAHQQFLRDTLVKLEGFKKSIDVNNEIAVITRQIIN